MMEFHSTSEQMQTLYKILKNRLVMLPSILKKNLISLTSRKYRVTSLLQVNIGSMSVKIRGPEQEYKLPDGQIISINDVRFKSAEILFTPDYCQGENNGLSDLLYESVMTIANAELQDLMFNNVVLSGGNTLFPGFEQRLKADLRKWNEIDIKIIAPKQRLYSVYIGGSILASLVSFQDQWTSKKKYEEEGSIMCLMNLPQEY